MSEKDFWTKYCKAEYLQWSKNSATVAAEAAEDEELAIFLKHDDILANEARRKVLQIPASQMFRGLGSIWQDSLYSQLFNVWGCFSLLSFSVDIFHEFDRIFLGQMRHVDPTLDMEADLGDDYMHLPVRDTSS